MISKELLSEVLGKPIGRIEIGREVKYYWEKTDTYCGSIDIHELMYECKEWLFKEGYEIIILSNFDFSWDVQIKPFTQDKQPDKWSYGKTEPEAIFKACQWLLENKE